jgi:hypothetical protein
MFNEERDANTFSFTLTVGEDLDCWASGDRVCRFSATVEPW